MGHYTAIALMFFELFFHSADLRSDFNERADRRQNVGPLSGRKEPVRESHPGLSHSTVSLPACCRDISGILVPLYVLRSTP